LILEVAEQFRAGQRLQQQTFSKSKVGPVAWTKCQHSQMGLHEPGEPAHCLLAPDGQSALLSFPTGVSSYLGPQSVVSVAVHCAIRASRLPPPARLLSSWLAPAPRGRPKRRGRSSEIWRSRSSLANRHRSVDQSVPGTSSESVPPGAECGLITSSRYH
jgi:hypothetical protein